jgi:hypothetical protein
MLSIGRCTVLVANGINAFERRYPKAALPADLRTEEETRQVFGVTNVAISALDASGLQWRDCLIGSCSVGPAR